MDPIKDGLNWYTYCGGNPVRYRDPSGLRPTEGIGADDGIFTPSNWYELDKFKPKITTQEQARLEKEDERAYLKREAAIGKLKLAAQKSALDSTPGDAASMSASNKARILLYGSDVGQINGFWHESYEGRTISGGLHQGTDFGAWAGIELKSIADAKVAYIKPVTEESTYSMLVLEVCDPFNPGEQIYISFLHLEVDENLYVGKPLSQGDLIGYEAGYGEGGVHTHIEISTSLWRLASDTKGAYSGRTVDPTSYFYYFYGISQIE